MQSILKSILFGSLLPIAACNNNGEQEKKTVKDPLQQYAAQRLAGYAPVKLTADLSALSEKEKQMIPLLIEAADIMDELYWQQSYGNKDSLLNSITDSASREFARINYGPWDKLNSDTPFIAGYGAKSHGAGFYPADMTKEELEKSDVKDKHGEYSVIRRDSAGKLIAIPYHQFYQEPLKRASELLKQAAALAEEPGLKKYLELRSEALITDNFKPSDIAWMDMKDNGLDVIIGPIENYEDQLYNSRNAYEAYILVKDKVWSKKLEKYVSMLPALQKGLPVDEKYKKEVPGTSSQLNAYDVIYYAGHCNSGGKTIAVNLPNSEELQKTKGTRRSQLKNAMKAKFDQILLPIAKDLIDPSQLGQVQFDAFFSNVMFHEVAHGLGIKNTVDGKGTVRSALQEQGSWLEEAKADILGLYMVTKLVEMGELPGPIENYYTTFMAGILRSVRFGAGEAHGKANMLAFNYFEEKGAFVKTQDGHYKVDMAKFRDAMNGLSNLILTLQGNGDKPAVETLMKEKAVVRPDLQADLNKLQQKGIPVDITFEQGVKVLGLK
ncbi:dipeptidyl-peptidase 3 family protein [Pseudobacter ginsenosidimutans]|nr:Zn-dependent hydrolase [Pseudobacter ginsenosidimutans]QEC40176.1 Zn-dependent hydrolase [Pseudobacter ginsenosidimutans]QEC45816.1 Zn-dependent hydrolase [Pseudobacter ginsenosidimutans]